MVMTPCIGQDFVRWSPPGGGDTTLGIVDFAIYPHLESPYFPTKPMANAEKWAATMPVPVYAMDDQTAIEVMATETSKSSPRAAGSYSL
jgi:dipeptidase E